MTEVKRLPGTKKMKRSKGDVVFDTVNVTILTIFMLIVLYPLYLVFISSISAPHAVMRGEVLLLPIEMSFDGYRRVLASPTLMISLRNTVIYTTFSIIFSIFMTMLAGFAMSRPFLGKRFISVYFLFTMFFSGGMIPHFLIVRDLGLYNTPVTMIILNALQIIQIFIARTVIRTSLPDELYDAASIDGCNQFGYFFRFVLPLSKALMGVLAVFYGTTAWNDFITGLIFIRDRNLQVFQVVLRDILATVSNTGAAMQEMMTQQETYNLQETIRIAHSIRYASIVISLIPMILIYLSAQKYFTRGVMLGSIKG